ncbi:hypothetical protein FEM48_Zijuj05G0039600 [Ziziphus jujuba var. spinosa]|uniref:Uncharacterized protein n=1 Tax=Ziziphus jujuba var. spinosa TaxID=714518 RepID=A0A978VCP6_ZIZJJ|nr:hypothetical protein FEM48_Zijuj05G0039600 [Ziziphus jujuba var. spinosa]
MIREDQHEHPSCWNNRKLVAGQILIQTWMKKTTYLLGWAWNLYKEKREVELVDSALMSEFNEKEVRRVIRIAQLCTQSSPSLRPSMSRVVAMLSGDVQSSTTISTPEYLLIVLTI